jgi:hypothetical protein
MRADAHKGSRIFASWNRIGEWLRRLEQTAKGGHGKERAFFYGCSANHKRGQAVCGNALVVRKERIDDAVLQALGGDLLDATAPEALPALVPDRGV